MHSTAPGFSLIGTTATLLVDSYFAIKYQKSTEQLEFNNFELFAQESWTQTAFNNSKSLRIQIGAPTMIFAQIFLTMAGTMEGQITLHL